VIADPRPGDPPAEAEHFIRRGVGGSAAAIGPVSPLAGARSITCHSANGSKPLERSLDTSTSVAKEKQFSDLGGGGRPKRIAPDSSNGIQGPSRTHPKLQGNPLRSSASRRRRRLHCGRLAEYIRGLICGYSGDLFLKHYVTTYFELSGGHSRHQRRGAPPVNPGDAELS